MPAGSRAWVSAAIHQARCSFALSRHTHRRGHVLTFGRVAKQGFNSRGLVARWYLAAKAGTLVYLNMGTAPSAGFAPAIQTIRALGASKGWRGENRQSVDDGSRSAGPEKTSSKPAAVSTRSYPGLHRHCTESSQEIYRPNLRLTSSERSGGTDAVTLDDASLPASTAPSGE